MLSQDKMASQGDVVEALRGAGDGFRALVKDCELRMWEQMKSLEERLSKGLVRDPEVAAQIARSVAQVMPGELSDRVVKMEERVASWEDTESRVRELGKLLSLQQSALGNAMKLLENLSKAADALTALAQREQPVPVVNFHPPPPKLLEKVITYDDMGRPVLTREREVES